ncbi:hypothetical protein [Pseudomonas aeruginosa]|uniref:hypothetical protein n=1 Tax=Pseudomonas aeruginosa TaxID=287 RepID=UPI000188FCCF|nr:hypothetical protein [Pseudomonas aeruginosa]AHC65162.1 hypothetical protein T223_12810 [Pseudomonas aeruginosa LES431]AHK95276.1 hypothetical protein T222_13140 [Pseudomonas aeruginosa LES400]MBA5163630.1 hypothetical protein [Pseudomonas aeruginosa]MBS9732732.1 hypothetical protein [Pseudomonas aeruginosa]CAW27241.1 hypothetical protein PLES_25151 [Pseudomonas aeruginosa LESB58]
MKSAVILAAILASCSAFAAKPATKAWTQEPSSFLGLTFESSSVMALPQCAPGVIGFQQTRLCREKPYGNLYTIEGKPSIGLRYNYHLSAKLNEGQVEYFMLTGHTDDFDKVTELFTEKYGKPTSRAAPSVKTKAGASFVNDTLVWDGARVSITLERFSTDINTFGAIVLNKPAAEASSRAAAEKTKSDASKL